MLPTGIYPFQQPTRDVTGCSLLSLLSLFELPRYRWPGHVVLVYASFVTSKSQHKVIRDSVEVFFIVYLMIAFEREDMSGVIEGESKWRIGIGETKLPRVARTFDRQSIL